MKEEFMSLLFGHLKIVMIIITLIINMLKNLFLILKLKPSPLKTFVPRKTQPIPSILLFVPGTLNLLLEKWMNLVI